MFSSPPPKPLETHQPLLTCVPKGYPKGFTLLEVLLAISLLSVIITLAYLSFDQISTHSQILNQNIQNQQKLRLLMHVVSEDLRAAYFLPSLAQLQQPSGLQAGLRVYEGKPFSWFSAHVVGKARLHRNAKQAIDPEVHETGYEVVQDEEGLKLVRREDYYIDGNLNEGGVKQVLVIGVKAFNLEFLPLRANEERGWVKEWSALSRTANDRMPVAIRFGMAIQNRQGRIFQEQTTFNLDQTLYSALRTNRSP